MSKVLGWAIVGCGDVADRKIGRYFKRDPGCRLISVMRRNGAAAESFARRHGAANWSTDAQETIRHPDVDAVYIATPPANHLEYALAVAAAGKPCVVEKPAGRSLAEFRSLRDAFRAANLPLFVSYYRRYLPRFLKVKEILDSGVLGPIVSIDYRKSKPAQQGGWALEVAQSGGGQFYGVACHMLDLFDFWFGPLEYTGSSATNSIPCQSSEDAVALSFRTKGGAVGAALWNFAASSSDDRLIIDGRRGRITMRGTSTDKSVRVDLDPKGKFRIGQGRSERWINNWRDRLGLPDGEVHRFPKVEYPHEAMLKEITARIGRDRDIPDNADAALRTAEIVDRSLASYYGGRDDEFWTRPSTWQSLHAKALRRNHDPLPSEYRLIEEHIRTFETTGYIGPFRCDADWQRLITPEKMGHNWHLHEADIFDICTHPSVIRRVAQVMGRSRFSLFKTRFPVKLPHGSIRI